MPHLVSFQGASTNNITNWQWNFGNGTSSNQQNPSATYGSTGTFTPSLTVTTINGCELTVSNPLMIHAYSATASFSATPVSGCLPLNVQFTDTSSPFDSIISWAWDFGDGGTSSLQNPSHTYSQHGDYTATLTITVSGGCTYSFSRLIEVGFPQVPAFSVSDSNFCASTTVQFNNLSTDLSLIDGYLWNFGDGNFSSASNPSHQYLDTGFFDVSLTVSYNGCDTTVMYPNFVYVNGPVAWGIPIVDCNNPYDITFDATFIDTTDWTWDYGDGDPLDTNLLGHIHTYDTTGVYSYTLTAFNAQNGCSFSFTEDVHVLDIQAVITLSDSGYCIYKPFQVDGTGSRDESTYAWSFPGAVTTSSTNSIPTVTYNSGGFHTITLIATDLNGCSDTASTDVFTTKPIAIFGMDTTFGCTGLPVSFTDSSTSDTNLVGWSWDFNNGNFSTLQNPSTSFPYYSNNGYDIELIVTDTFGCTDTAFQQGAVTIIQPFPEFSVDTQTCELEVITFNNQSTGQNWTYAWDFGDGNTSSAINPLHAYATSGWYDITYQVTDSLGCDSTLVRPQYIEVQALPQANFGVSDTFSACWPFEVSFYDSSTSPFITDYYWDFGDTSQVLQTNLTSVNYTYNFAGDIDVGLIVETNYGCRDTLYQNDLIEIQGPFAIFQAFPDTVCLGEPVFFTVDTAINVLNITFNFGDGNSAAVGGDADTVSHLFTDTATITVDVIYVDSNGLCPKYDTLDLFIHNVVGNWNLGSLTGCTPYAFPVEDASIGSNAWIWDFGDGGSSSLDSLTYTYQDSGNFNVQLIAYNDTTGCADTISAALDINSPPAIYTLGETFICDGLSVPLNVFGGLNYEWSPAITLTNPFVPNPTAFPSADETYYVSVTDDIGCLSVDSVNVYVQTKPEIVLFPPDVSLYDGEVFEHNVQLNQDYEFSWSPTQFLNCPSCLNVSTRGREDITYTLTVWDTNNCFVIDSSFTVTLDYNGVFIPNAFSPNGDGRNDVLYIYPRGVKDLVSFNIYDRWGSPVFSASSFDKGWDGSVNGEVLPGQQVYMYVAIIRLFNGDEQELRGTILKIDR